MCAVLTSEMLISSSDALARPVPEPTESADDLRAVADREGFRQLYVSAFPKVYAFIRSHVRTAEIAQDIVGRIFLKAYQHFSKAPAGSAALVWLFRIARTVLIDHWRVEGRRGSSRVSIEDVADIPGTTVNPEVAYSQKEQKALVMEALQELSHGDRTILSLKFSAQQTNREISVILDLQEAAVSMRLLRGLRRLRARLIAKGVERGR